MGIDRLVVDEAEDLPAAEVGAPAPTVFACPRAQQVYAGTAPGPAHDSEAWSALRRAAHEGLKPRLAWFEWVADYGQEVDVEQLWVRVDPAVAAGRVPLQAIRDDRAVLPLDVFRTERLSMWLPTGAAAVFDPAAWERLTEATSTVAKDLVIGLDAPLSRESATVCLAGRRDDGRLHAEWYHSKPGVTWLPGMGRRPPRPEREGRRHRPAECPCRARLGPPLVSARTCSGRVRSPPPPVGCSTPCGNSACGTAGRSS